MRSCCTLDHIPCITLASSARLKWLLSQAAQGRTTTLMQAKEAYSPLTPMAHFLGSSTQSVGELSRV
jgi:hypothetical protein